MIVPRLRITKKNGVMFCQDVASRRTRLAIIGIPAAATYRQHRPHQRTLRRLEDVAARPLGTTMVSIWKVAASPATPSSRGVLSRTKILASRMERKNRARWMAKSGTHVTLATKLYTVVCA